jgi:hypothetical protein
MRSLGIALFLAAVTLPAAAQSVVIGSQSQLSGLAIANTGPITIIDLAHPASAAGTVSSASVHWITHSCTSAFKLKVFRLNSSLTSATLVAERGPFNALAGRNQIVLTPGIAVSAGDVLAVTILTPFSTCGTVSLNNEPAAHVIQQTGDFAGGAISGTFVPNGSLGVRATDTTEVLEGVITAAGSLQGGFGSFFRTALQITCPGGGTCTGKLVFHPAGTAASPSDQALPYTVDASGTAYTDIVNQMGKSGLGTLDVISSNGFPPQVVARIYNDAGSAGTSGFTEDLIPTAKALHAGDLVALLTPADLTNFRANVGVRTFGSPATINVQYGFRSQSNVTFPANTFQQVSLTAFGDTSPVANEQIYLFVLSGDAIIYISTTDNRTNDSSVRFAQRE